jgi:hypothetical protein
MIGNEHDVYIELENQLLYSVVQDGCQCFVAAQDFHLSTPTLADSGQSSRVNSRDYPSHCNIQK